MIRTCTKNPSLIPTNIYGWNDCSDHMQNNSLEESYCSTSTWTNKYTDSSIEHTLTQTSGLWLHNSQSISIIAPTKLNLFRNGSAYQVYTNGLLTTYFTQKVIFCLNYEFIVFETIYVPDTWEQFVVLACLATQVYDNCVSTVLYRNGRSTF